MQQTARCAPTTDSTRQAVFRCLYHAEESVTKQEISQRTNLSLPTVYQAFNALDADGLILPGEERGSTGGRRARTYAIASRSAAAIGASVTGDRLRLVACDLFGHTVALHGARDREVPTDGAHSFAELCELVAGAARSFADDLEATGVRALGTGIAVPSAIDPTTGALANMTVIGLAGDTGTAAQLESGVEAKTGHRALVMNDAACGGFSEQFGVRDTESLVYLSLERGVGGSVIVAGKSLDGVHGASAEFGHLCLEPGGRRCACGNCGCLEAYCSSARLSDDLNCSLGQFFGLLEAGDAEALQAWDDFADHLARGIQLVHMSFDLEIVLGGLLSQYLPAHLEDLMARIEKLGDYGDPHGYLRLTRHPHHAVPLGAAQRVVADFVETASF